MDNYVDAVDTVYSECYAILLNDIAENSDLPFDLDGWTLDRATVSEISVFRPQLANLIQFLNRLPVLPYECSVTNTSPGTNEFKAIADQSSWRYTIVRGKNKGRAERRRLDEALRICPDDLRVGAWVGVPAPTVNGTISHPPVVLVKVPNAVNWFYHFRDDYTPQTVNLDRIKSICVLRESFNESNFPGVVRALTLFREMDELSDSLNSKLLGHFAILEAILSHSPERHDPVDSITRQLKRNLNLLDHRMSSDENLQLSQFKDAKSEQVITRLYGVRSSVAHGGDPSGDINWLNKNRPTTWGHALSVHRYVRLISQRVLVAALSEPQLVADLRGA